MRHGGWDFRLAFSLALNRFLITRLRQLEIADRTDQEHIVSEGVWRGRAIGSNSRKASAKPISAKAMEPKSNVIRRSSPGAGRAVSNVRIVVAAIIASSRAGRGGCSNATPAASRLPSRRERFSPQANCRCPSGSSGSITSRNSIKASPASNSAADSASPRRRGQQIRLGFQARRHHPVKRKQRRRQTRAAPHSISR